ncbi:MAG: ABC transporter ATP-binding protein [Bacillota bacterium]
MSLTAHALAFGFPRRVIGSGIDLRLDAGRVLCVLGPNGAGKTTLFRTLLGLLPAIEGRVEVDGADVARLPRRRIARSVAYVPQSSALAFDFTLFEIVLMGRIAHLGPLGSPRRADIESATSALERLGIGALAHRSFDEVSGGERQLALIARALATEARTIVMDEPTANLDFGNQARVLAEITRLREQGIAILLCSHDPQHALEVADEALLLDAGRAIAQGPVRETLTAQNLTRLYRVPVEIASGTIRARARRDAPPL